MTRGHVTKLVRSFGSSWGRIQPEGETRDIFFNTASLRESAGFLTLSLGQEVDFCEVRDLANGSRAQDVQLTHAGSGPNVEITERARTI
jgi:cold shock CspA family protein